jgi:hypothetical protein
MISPVVATLRPYGLERLGRKGRKVQIRITITADP